jgi:predicted esterase
MITRLHTACKGFLIPLLLLTITLAADFSQVQAQCGYGALTGERISGINVAGGYYPGLIRWLPSDYVSNPTKKYPLIIYFHGAGAVGDGSATDLCKIFTDVSYTIPDRIERGEWNRTGTAASVTHEYLVIAPQYASYGDPYLYANETEQLINYLIANYRVDTARIYLTGMSTGANQVIDYLSSSQARASRIAAASFASLCFPTNLSSAGTTLGPANVANGRVATWFTHCTAEVTGVCGIASPTGWVDGINSNSPVRPPRFTQISSGSPDTLNNCRGFAHDTWTAMYSPNFAPTDGGPNFYNWALQFQSLNSTLPVALKSFTARLNNGKVYLRWVTTVEEDNSSFTLERSANSQQFTVLKTIAGAGHAGSEKVYEYVDEKPLANLSFYRLQQTDASGKQRYYDIRKVMNKAGGKRLIAASPNPFTTELTAFITVDKTQRVDVWIADINGRTLAAVNGSYSPGTTAVDIPTVNLPKGIYFLKASGEGISETYKIMKQ